MVSAESKVDLEVGINEEEADKDALKEEESERKVAPIKEIPKHHKKVSHSHNYPNVCVVLFLPFIILELPLLVERGRLR